MRWNSMTEEERTNIHQKPQQYANAPLHILEEWAARRVESGAMRLDAMQP